MQITLLKYNQSAIQKYYYFLNIKKSDSTGRQL